MEEIEAKDRGVYTLDTWESEIRLFRSALHENPSEEVGANLLKGLCYLTHITLQDNPSKHDQITVLFKEAYREIQDVKGSAWVYQHLTIINGHLSRKDIVRLLEDCHPPK
jgi:hypothetical protein